MKTLLLVSTLALGASPAMAALSGYYDSAEQIGVILGSAELADALRQAPIDKIEHERATTDGLIEWEVESRDCELSVFLRALAPAGADGTPVVGKATYEVARIGACH